MTVVDAAEFSNRAIQNIMDIFITPEVRRRQDTGQLPIPVKLIFAQVILFPDERQPLIRINEEVRAKAKIKFKSGVSKKPGDAIYENEIDEIEYVELAPSDDPNCGHIFLYFYGTTTFMSFDSRRNRALARNHIQRAEDYLMNASHAWKASNLAPCIDSLFNAAELAVKAMLLVMYDYPPSLRAKSSHHAIHIRFNRFADMGNVIPKYKNVYNKLGDLRNAARYLKRDLPELTDDDVQGMLDAVGEMLEEAYRSTE